MSEFCPSCGTRLHQEYEQKRLKELLAEEQRLVGLWSRIFYVSEKDLDAKNFVALDATQTSVILNIIRLFESLKTFPSSELS